MINSYIKLVFFKVVLNKLRIHHYKSMIDIINNFKLKIINFQKIEILIIYSK